MSEDEKIKPVRFEYVPSDLKSKYELMYEIRDLLIEILEQLKHMEYEEE